MNFTLLTATAETAAAPGIDYVNSVAKTISELGVTVVICAVILIFLGRILNSMVKQVDTTYESVLPKIQSVIDQVTAAQNAIITTVTTHNSNSGAKLYELRTDVDSAQKDLEKLVDTISSLNAQVQRLDSNIDSNQKLMIQVIEEIHNLSRDYGTLRTKIGERPCLATDDDGVLHNHRADTTNTQEQD